MMANYARALRGVTPATCTLTHKWAEMRHHMATSPFLSVSSHTPHPSRALRTEEALECAEQRVRLRAALLRKDRKARVQLGEALLGRRRALLQLPDALAQPLGVRIGLGRFGRRGARLGRAAGLGRRTARLVAVDGAQRRTALGRRRRGIRRTGRTAARVGAVWSPRTAQPAGAVPAAQRLG